MWWEVGGDVDSEVAERMNDFSSGMVLLLEAFMLSTWQHPHNNRNNQTAQNYNKCIASWLNHLIRNFYPSKNSKELALY